VRLPDLQGPGLLTSQADRPAFDPIETLTSREREVLGLFAQGLENKVIAAQLSVSEETVRAHAKNIYRKLRVRNRMQASLLLKP
jgi:two-component system nitrate/nitrite response regulator NarP